MVFFLIIGVKVGVSVVGLDRALFPWALAIPHIILFGYVWWLVQCKNKLCWGEIGFRFPKQKIYFAVALFLVPLNLSVAIIYASVAVNLGIEKIIPPQIPVDILGAGWMVIINVIAITIWVPVIEETFFRGFLLTRLMKGMGVFGSVTVTSLMFALMHGHIGLWVPVFLNSCCISVLFIKGRSLYPVVLVHGLQNAIVSLVAASA